MRGGEVWLSGDNMERVSVGQGFLGKRNNWEELGAVVGDGVPR